MQITKYIQSFLELFYPNLCLCCSKNSLTAKQSFCLSCLHQFPFTNHFEIDDNELVKRFYGRVSLESGMALLYNYKAGLVSGMIHQLKYKKNKYIGQELGLMIGNRLIEKANYQKPDYIIPVPIHAKRRKVRGYNQSEIIGKSISDKMKVPMLTDVLFKNKSTTTQTKKSRADRMANIFETFSVRDTSRLIGKHILIIDDVMTTGATIEACAESLKEVADLKLSVVTLAIAKS